MTFPRLVLRDEVADLLDLPWERPLGSWDDTGYRFRELPVGPPVWGPVGVPCSGVPGGRPGYPGAPGSAAPPGAQGWPD